MTQNITKSAFIPAVVYLDDSSATLDTDKATLFNRYFYSVFSQNVYSLPAFDDMSPTNSIIDSISITEDEVFNTLTSLDSTKATGIDEISPAVLKHCAFPLTKPLHYLFSYAFITVVFLQNGESIALSQYLKPVIKIVFLTTDPYLYFA